MSEFFENNKPKEAEEIENKAEINDEEINSTIFSDPAKKDEKVKKPALVKKILLGVGAILGVIAIIVAVWQIKVMNGQQDPQNNTVPEYYLLADLVQKSNMTAADGSVVEVENLVFDSVNLVDLKSDLLSLNFKADKSGENIVWLLEGMEAKYTSEATVENAVEAALGLKYTKIISETIEDPALYGFDKPLYTINVTPAEGDGYTITVGKQSGDKSGYYVTCSVDNKAYFVRNVYIDSLKYENEMEFTKALSIEAFDSAEGSAEYYNQGSLVSFDSLYFTNSLVNVTYKFETVPSEDRKFNTYYIVEPKKRAANDTDTGILPIIELFANGINSEGLYAITKGGEELAKYGLDIPDLKVSIKAGKQERTIIAKLQADGDYAVISSDMDVILRVPADRLTPAKMTEKNLYSEFIFVEKLAEMSYITLNSESVNHNFTIIADLQAETFDQVKGIKVDGGEIMKPDEFQSYYSFLLGIKLVNYNTTDISGKTPKATMTFNWESGRKMTVSYYQAQNGRYQVVVDGEQQGLIGSSNFNNILKYAENVAAGKVFNAK